MKKHADDEDDSPPGGRALDRLKQFEIERGYQEADEAMPAPQEEEGQSEATDDAQQDETSGGGAESGAATALADC